MSTDEKLGNAFYENMGASLLAAQPVTDQKDKADPSQNWETVFTHLEASLSSMRNWRWSWWSHWNRLAEYFLPRRHDWVVVANRMNRGSPINDAIVDSTATLAMQVCASGLWAGLTSPSRPWFKLECGIPWEELDRDGRNWLEDTEARIYSILAQSNFYTTMAQCFQDVTVFGTSPVIIYEDYDNVIRCYLPCAGEYFLKVGSRLSVDTLYREFAYTVQQIVEQFGVKNCPQQVQKLWQQGGASLNLEFIVAHAIEPNFALSKSGEQDSSVRVVPGLFTYREVYWLKNQKTARPLSVRGFRTKPFFAARWATKSNDPYGRSPCMDALGDTKQLQQETRRKAEFIEKLVRPPMGANPELKNEPSSIIPGMITYTSTDNGKKGFWPLFEVQPAALAPMVQDLEKISDRINRTLFVDIFMAISRMEGVQPRNELELTKRDLERLQVLGPFVHHFETECAGPAIRRVFDIGKRGNLFKPLPKSLQSIPITIKYTSIMRLAQRAAESVSMKDGFVTLGQLSSAAKAAGVPDPIRVMDLDKAFRKYAELTNFPADVMFTEAEVKKNDAIVAKAHQAAQAPGQAMAAVSAAKTLAEIPTGGGTLGGSLMGGGGMPG